MTDSNAIVNTMWDVSFSNRDMYESPESGRVIVGEKFMKASSANCVFLLSLYEYEYGNWIYDPSHTLATVYIRFISW